MATEYQQKEGASSLRPALLFSFALVYLLPLVLFGMHSLHSPIWGLFFGLLIGLLGLALFSLFIRNLESEPALVHAPERTDLEEELLRLTREREQLEEKAVEQGQELYRLRSELEEARSERDSVSSEYQQVLAKQRAHLESKAEQVEALESKVHDLSFELRTLLAVDERDAPLVKEEEVPLVETLPLSSDQQVRTQYDAFVLLHRCLQTAQSLTGAGHFSGEEAGHFLSHATIDLRRLFDKLRTETGAVVTVYSPAEGRLLFAGPATRSHFGWSSERFVREFSTLVQGGRREWEEAVETLRFDEEASLRLVIRGKEGEPLLTGVCMAMVSKGAFRGCILAVLYLTSTRS